MTDREVVNEQTKTHAPRMVKGRYGTYPFWIVAGFRSTFLIALLALVMAVALWLSGSIQGAVSALIVFGVAGGTAGHFITAGEHYQHE